MSTEEMMIIEEIKGESLLIYDTTLLTPRTIRDASQSKSVRYLHAKCHYLLCGVLPSGSIAHTMVLAKLQSGNVDSNTHTHSWTFTLHSHTERDRDESKMMINKENSGKSYTESA